MKLPACHSLLHEPLLSYSLFNTVGSVVCIPANLPRPLLVSSLMDSTRSARDGLVAASRATRAASRPHAIQARVLSHERCLCAWPKLGACLYTKKKALKTFDKGVKKEDCFQHSLSQMASLQNRTEQHAGTNVAGKWTREGDGYPFTSVKYGKNLPVAPMQIRQETSTSNLQLCWTGAWFLPVCTKTMYMQQHHGVLMQTLCLTMETT